MNDNLKDFNKIIKSLGKESKRIRVDEIIESCTAMNILNLIRDSKEFCEM